jgi:hypothetical protein
MKQVSTAYGLVTTNPIALDTSASEESNPTISKSCGQSNGQPAQWIATWQRFYSSTDQDCYGRFVNWNGALPGAVFTVAGSGANDTAPSASSPIEANGVRYWPVVWETATSPGQQRDILCRLFHADGSLLASGTVSNNVPNADDRDPEVDSDGARFVVGLTTGTPGYGQLPQAVTMAYLPSNNTFREDGRSGMNTSSLDNYGECNVCADYSGGSSPSPRFFVSFSVQANNTFNLVNLGGFTGSSTLFQYRSTQCGSLPITGGGWPVLGQTVTVTAANGGLSGTYAGFPSFLPLLQALGCNCWLGVDPGTFTPNPFVWSIPIDPLMVGTTISVQGFTITGSQCLGNVDLSDTVDFTIR